MTDFDGESTGLPFFRNWRGVYGMVTVSFIVWVILLLALARIFS